MSSNVNSKEAISKLILAIEKVRSTLVDIEPAQKRITNIFAILKSKWHSDDEGENLKWRADYEWGFIHQTVSRFCEALSQLHDACGNLDPHLFELIPQDLQWVLLQGLDASNFQADTPEGQMSAYNAYCQTWKLLGLHVTSRAETFHTDIDRVTGILLSATLAARNHSPESILPAISKRSSGRPGCSRETIDLYCRIKTAGASGKHESWHGVITALDIGPAKDGERLINAARSYFKSKNESMPLVKNSRKNAAKSENRKPSRQE